MCVFFSSHSSHQLGKQLHTTPLDFTPLSCFDHCYQGISCVRLMGFFFSLFLWVLRFSNSSLRCFELDFCCSFSKVGLNLRRVVYLRVSCNIYSSFSSRFFLLFNLSFFSSSFFLFFFYAIYLLRHTT